MRVPLSTVKSGRNNVFVISSHYLRTETIGHAYGIISPMVCQGRHLGMVATVITVLTVLSGCKHAKSAKALTLTFQQIYVADTIPANRGEHVTTAGVVLYCDPLWHLLVLQDSNQRVYFDPPANLELHAGDQVQINGIVADPGKFLEHAEFRITDSGKMPLPLKLERASQFRDHATFLVEVPATVRWSGIRNGRAQIEAYAGDGRLTALVFPSTSEDLPRLGSEVTIAGVATASTDGRSPLQEWTLLTPSPRYIQVLKPGPKDPFSVPLAHLSALGDAQVGKLVHVAGKISDRSSGVVLAEQGRQISVSMTKPLHRDFSSAEVVGFWSGSAIEDAAIRPTGELLSHSGDIRTISDLKHLSLEEASSRRPVSIRGVVTYFDPVWGLLFVQDRGSAVFVNTSASSLQLKTGDLVDISGVSGPGDYAPVILDPAVSFVGRAALPQPTIVDAVQSNLSMADSHWASLFGVVHSAQFLDGHTKLKLGAGEAAVNVQLPTLIDGQRYLDKEISVTGVLGILFNEKRQAIGHQLFVPAPEFIRIVGTGGKPNAKSTIAMLRRYSPEFDEHHSVSFQGQVVLKSTPNMVFVQDDTAGIQIRSVEPLNLNLGDRVSVRGFLRNGEYSPAVEDAVVTRVSTGALPEPEHVSTDSLDIGRHDSQYVVMAGTLAATRPALAGLTLVLNQKGTYFDITGPPNPDLNSLRLGSEIEARGVFQAVLDRTHVPYTINGFTLAFDSPTSIRVRKVGPWWDGRKVRWAGVLFAIFAALTALWAIMLRRKVLTRTRELQSSLGAQNKAQQFDRARNEILETIARNAPLPESMERLTLAIQEQLPETICMVLMPPDGKSFVDGKPSPLLIAPGLPEHLQHSHTMVATLQNAVKTDDSHLLAADEDLIETIKTALKALGLTFACGQSTLVFSASGSVSGMLILLTRRQTAVADEQAIQGMLQSASRLISLSRDHWQMHERLLHEARHDGLTGLPNRAVAEDRLEQALARAERRKKSFAVFCIDLDGFKGVNDELGHDVGDELLRTVAQRFRGRIRHSDTLARMGGDEFIAIIDDCAGDAAASAVANSLIASLNDRVLVEARELSLSASIGIAMYPADGQNAAQLRRNADLAMYRAKSAGGGQVCFLSRIAKSPVTMAQKGHL
jgi:diguanylate cyclase (GGDEF)-like protein